MRITVSAPELLVPEANQLAMVLGFSLADGETFVGLNWKDASGNLYSAASFEASEDWVTKAESPLVRPSWDVDNQIDMAMAEEAQSVLIYSQEPLLANKDNITAIGGMEGIDALIAMGLTTNTNEE